MSFSVHEQTQEWMREELRENNVRAVEDLTPECVAHEFWAVRSNILAFGTYGFADRLCYAPGNARVRIQYETDKAPTRPCSTKYSFFMVVSNLVGLRDILIK